MKDGETRLAGSRRIGAAARVLVAGQVALSLVLLVAAVHVREDDGQPARRRSGLQRARVRVADARRSIPVLSRADDSQDAAGAVLDRVLERVRALPGVRAASLSVLTPLSGRDTGRLVTVPGYQLAAARGPHRPRESRLGGLLPDVRHARCWPAARSRRATPAIAVKVAVINEAAARAYFAGRAPIGETIRFGTRGVYQIVGVVRDHKHLSVRDERRGSSSSRSGSHWTASGASRWPSSSDQPAPTLVRAVADARSQAVHPNTLVSDVIAVQEQIDATLVSERLLSTLATAFAALALGLAAIGLYGVLSYFGRPPHEPSSAIRHGARAPRRRGSRGM